MIVDINTISELLENFIPTGVNEIEQAIIDNNITHPVTIGTMYEGLTKEVVDGVIFEGLNLKIVTNCHIEGSTKEFDVLLIENEPKRLPFSDRYICKPEQVLAIIQVKKNLYSSGLADGYENLKALVDHYEDRELEPYMKRLLRDGFRAICNKDIAAVSISSLDDQENAIFHSLRIDAQLPVRVIWGFNGFAGERSFRESFYEYLSTNITTDVNNIIGYYGPHNFPSLIICQQYSLLKQNGMPFGYPLFDDHSWPFYTSSSQSPTKYLLELLWTKLSYKYGLSSDIFGEDLEVEQVNTFLDCTYGELEGHKGWHYHAFSPSKDFFKETLVNVTWAPVEIDKKQFVIIEELGKKGEIDISKDKDLESFITEGNVYLSLQDFLVKFLKTGLVYIDDNKLRLLTDECQCVFLPDGRVVAADNKSGRLTAWVSREIKRKKEES